MQPQTNSTKRVRDFSVGCVVIFMLPFFMGGGMAAWSGIQALLHGDRGMQAFAPLIAGAIFIGFSAVIFGVVIVSIRGAAANAALRQQNPDKPWLWRKEWSDGVIVNAGGAQATMIGFVAVVWNAISLPSAYIVLSSEDVREQPAVLFILIFPIVGVFLLLTAAYQLLRVRKYGQSRVMLAHIPISIGATARGEVVTHVKERPENGFDLKLQCVRRITTGSGKNRSTSETELWRGEQRVSGLTAIPTVDGFRVPFTFDVPGDARATDDSVPNDQIVWRLTASAETPGIDYAASFEVPVFVTSETQHEVKRFVPSTVEVTSWTPSPQSRITILPDEIRVAARARPRDVVTMLLFCLFWFGVVGILFHLAVAIFFAIVFGLLGLLVVYAMIDAVIGRTSIRADRSGIVVRRSWFGAGIANTISAENITSIVANPTPNSATYEIDVIGANNRKTQIARYIKERHDAEMLAARLARAVLPTELS